MEPFLYLTTAAEDAAREAAEREAASPPAYPAYLFMGDQPGPRYPAFRVQVAGRAAVTEYRAAHPLTADEIEALWRRWYFAPETDPGPANPYREVPRVRALAPWGTWHSPPGRDGQSSE